jgi:hypothetical protein
MSISALRSFTLALSDDFLYNLYHEVSPRWSGLPDNPDHPSPHIVRMAEGLLHVYCFVH